jgi:hypothetical protein
MDMVYRYELMEVYMRVYGKKTTDVATDVKFINSVITMKVAGVKTKLLGVVLIAM